MTWLVDAIAPLVLCGTVPTISNRHAPSSVADSGTPPAPILAH